MAACEKLGLELRDRGRRARARAPGGHGRPAASSSSATSTPEELRDLYRGARLFLQPGVEDFGIASVEALACGTPVVAVARGGILDVVEDGRHGVLYPDWEGPPALCDGD